MDWSDERVETVKAIEEKIATKGEEPGTKTEMLLWKQNNRTHGNKEELSEESFRT